MRVIVHGQQAFGKAVLEAILERGVDNVVAVYCPPDDGESIDSLKERAIGLSIPLYQPTTYKDPKVWAQVANHNADLCVMTNVTMFVPEEALYAPGFGSIQFHPSLLPEHRGKSPIHWAIITGKCRTGLSVFWPDNGLDTGPILLQKQCDIGPDETFGTLYTGKLFPMGVAALLESIDHVRAGTAQKRAQDLNAGSAESECSPAHGEIEWSMSARDVYNLVRGCNPTPGAWGQLGGYEVTLLDCRLDASVNASTKTPVPAGTVTQIDNEGFRVALKGGSLRVSRVRIDASPELSAAEWFSAEGADLLGQRFEQRKSNAG